MILAGFMAHQPKTKLGCDTGRSSFLDVFSLGEDDGRVNIFRIRTDDLSFVSGGGYEAVVDVI